MPALHTTQPTTAKTRISGVTAVLRALRAWARRRHDRQSLARLDAHMLHDIGLTASARNIECHKAFWRD